MLGNNRKTWIRALSAACLWAFTLGGILAGTSLSLFAATSQPVGVGVRIKLPPEAITNLSAAAVGSQNGDIQLSWSAPYNINGAAISHYLVRYATFPSASVPVAETWWADAAATQNQVGPAMAPGVQEFSVLPGFTAGVTYYFGIKSVDVTDSFSAIDTRVGTGSQANSLPVSGVISSPPSTPTNFVGTALSSTSVQWSWDASATATFYQVSAFPSDALINSTTDLYLIESGLLPNTDYVRRVRAANGYGLSAPTPAETRYTQAAIPANLQFTMVGYNEISLTWNNSGNPTGTTYRLERSNDGVNFINAALTTQTTAQDTGLTQLTTYYYRLRSINGDGISTTPTVVISTFTRSQAEVQIPLPPMGLKGALDPSGNAFTLIWEEVDYNDDGSPATDVVGYHVYRRSSLNGTPTLVTPTPITLSAFADVVNNQTFFYTVRAVNSFMNESADSLIADSSPFENVIFLSTDGVSSVIMPSDINNLLRSEFNKYKVPLTVRLVEENVPNDTNIVRTIRLDLVRLDTNEVISDLSFSRPNATVQVGYSLVGGQVGIGQPAPATGATVTGQSTGQTPDKLVMFWNNGVNWIRVGGTVDQVEQVVKTQSSFLGRYQLRVGTRASSLILNKANVYPSLITPNDDGLNDVVFFVLENPNGAEVSGEIVDLKGRFVGRLSPAAGNGIGTTLTWDGKDQSGNPVPSGAYIYRIEGEGQTFTGTLGVAR